MPLFLSDEEYASCAHDPSLITQKADAYIRELYNQLETEKAQYDASSITAEQTCSLLEQRYVSLKAEFATLQAQHTQVCSTLEERVAEVAQIQADKHQIYLESIGKDEKIEQLSLEASELQKSKSQLLQLIEHKDLEINEKNSSIKGYLDKIVALTDSASSKDLRIIELEGENARVLTSSARLTQEKELVDRHNLWLNDELTTKANSLLELRKVHNELEADMSSKLADLERKYNESCSSLKWKDDRVKELEAKLEALQAELCSTKDTAATTEERLSTELSTVNKLVELYKENSDEWSKKSGELEGVIKALETHSNQVENDYKERLSKETSARIQFENEVLHLKEKLEKCEKELESYRNLNQLNLLTSFNAKEYGGPVNVNRTNEDNNLMLVPSIPAGISGTALAASLLRDGWSLVKMYEKYQEAVDALRHEQLGRKQSQSILERVLHEIEEKAEVILAERAEHERMAEAYAMLNEKLQNSLSEQTVLEKTIQELKAELRKHERDYSLAQKENKDLQKEVTVLLKECRDIQLRCGSVSYDTVVEDQMDVADDVFSDRMLTYKDINSLVEQNVQLRGLVRLLTEQVETKEAELKEIFEKEFEEHSKETASKVEAVLARAEEQAQMIDSLHTSVAMYKKLYEEEQKYHAPQLESSDLAPVDKRNNVPLLLEASHDSPAKKAQEKAHERIVALEEEISGLRTEIVTLRSQRDKLTLESTFALEKLDRFMKDFDRQREEMNGVISRNVEFSQLIVDYQRKIREASESLHIAEDMSRKLNMEVSVLQREKEILKNSEKRAFEEVHSMSERVHQLQATLNTIQSAEEVREESRSAHRISQEDYVKRTEREWAEAKQELEKERDHVRQLTHEHESAMRRSMQRIEEMGKELASALHAVADANSRASAAEERLSQFERMKRPEVNDESALTSKDDMTILREEVEKLRAEAQSNKDHMLQYKRLAQVNEAALKEMEIRHEQFKSEAEKVKKLLEDEILTLKERINQLQDGYNAREKEAAFAAVSQEQALASSLSEIFKLREEITAKTLHIEGLESQMSAMKDDLEKEHHRWRTAQDNYERQVMLQSETIQELTKTSQDLAVNKEKASELQKVSDILKIENEQLKSKWETEKLVLEDSKDKAEKKFSEINEQNKILHDQLEALHIKLAEKSKGSGFGAQSSDDDGLQNVVKYLRRSKEIAETEISLLKQEKLRLQSQLEAALKAESEAQALLRTERENSRSVHFTEDEFKALQVQVREMNLLRESNVQLREENRHNFEECQKLRQLNQNAKIEVEKLNTLLVERQNEVEACKKEIEVQKKDRNDIETKASGLLDRFKDMDPADYVRMQAEFQQINVKLSEKDGQLEEIKKRVSEKQGMILRLEHDLERSKVELDERQSKIDNAVQAESSLKIEVDKFKRMASHFKSRCEKLVKEKDETVKKNLELSRESVESNQVKRSNVDSSGELAEKDARIQMLEKTVEKLREEFREKEEKDTRIQMLEKIVDRLREDVKKGKEEIRIEKAKNQKTDKGKLADDLAVLKQALKTVSDEIGKLKHEGGSFDGLVAACLVAVENFEQVANQVSDEFGVVTSVMDTQPVDSGAPPRSVTNDLVTTTTPTAPAVSPAQTVEKRAKLPVSSKPKVEPRKIARRLVRPSIVKLDQPRGDVGLPDAVDANEPSVQLSVRKRRSHSEEPEGSNVHDRAADVAPPQVKKSRGFEQAQEGSDVPETFTEALAVDESQTIKEDDTGKDEEVETGEEQVVEGQAEFQNDRSDNTGEENVTKTETDVSEDHPLVTEVEHTQLPPVAGEGGSDAEEGDMISDAVIENYIRSPSPMPVEDELAEETLGDTEVSSPLLTMEDNEDKTVEEGDIEVDETTPESSTDKFNTDGNDESGSMAVESTAAAVTAPLVPEKSANASAMAEQPPSAGSVVSNVSTSAGPSEGKPEEPVVDTSLSTITLNERARLRSLQRPPGAQPSPPVARGRGRLPLSRTRGGRTGRGGGQTPGSQGM